MLKVVSHTLLKPRKMSLTVNRNEKAPFKCGIPVLFQNNGFSCYKTKPHHSFIQHFMLQHIYLISWVVTQTLYNQASWTSTRIHSHWLIWIPFDLPNFQLPWKEYVHALLRVCCRRYMKSGSVSHWNSTLFFDLQLWREDWKPSNKVLLQKEKITCSSSTEKVNHYVAMRSRCETVFHWN